MFDSFSYNSVIILDNKQSQFKESRDISQFLDQNLTFNEHGIQQFRVYSYNHFINPIFKSKVEQIDLTIEIRYSNVSFELICRINGEGKVIRDWHITETIDTKEQDEIVKSVLKMVLSEIDKSIL
jgi:hypothetical protein